MSYTGSTIKFCESLAMPIELVHCCRERITAPWSSQDSVSNTVPIKMSTIFIAVWISYSCAHREAAHCTKLVQSHFHTQLATLTVAITGKLPCTSQARELVSRILGHCIAVCCMIGCQRGQHWQACTSNTLATWCAVPLSSLPSSA